MKTVVQKSLWLVVVLAIVACAAQQATQWKVHDESRPHPPVVTPGATDNDPPSDAIVLFDGTDLTAWKYTLLTLVDLTYRVWNRPCAMT